MKEQVCIVWYYISISLPIVMLQSWRYVHSFLLNLFLFFSKIFIFLNHSIGNPILWCWGQIQPHLLLFIFYFWILLPIYLDFDLWLIILKNLVFGHSSLPWLVCFSFSSLFNLCIYSFVNYYHKSLGSILSKQRDGCNSGWQKGKTSILWILSHMNH